MIENPFRQRPYIDAEIDRWKLLLLVILSCVFAFWFAFQW